MAALGSGAGCGASFDGLRLRFKSLEVAFMVLTSLWTVISSVDMFCARAEQADDSYLWKMGFAGTGVERLGGTGILRVPQRRS